MRGDWHAGAFLRASGGAQGILLVGRYIVLAGGAFDDAGLDPGIGDALGDFADIDLGDFFHRALFEISGVAEVFLIKTGRADDVDAGFFADFGHEGDVAPDIHRTWIDHRLEAQVLQRLERLDAILERALAVELGDRAIELPSRPSDQKMLMHQGGAELLRRDSSGDSIDLFHGPTPSRS